MMMGGLGDNGPFRFGVPTAHGGILANGTSLQVTATAEITLLTGGFPPYTYDWTDNSANAFVQTSAADKTMIRSTGTNTENTGSLILIVGQANGVFTTASIPFSYIHGTP